MDARMRRPAAPRCRRLRWLLPIVFVLGPFAPARAQSADPALLANLARGARDVLTALDGRRTAEDGLLLNGAIARLQPFTVPGHPAPVSVIDRSWQKTLAVDPRYVEEPDGLRADAAAILSWWHGGGARARVKGVVPDAIFKEADDAVEAYNDFRLDQAMLLVRTRLDRYQVKYGPGSARLNFLEVGLNAVLQATPWFRPNREGPSPNEILLGYDTAWGTVARDKAQAVSTLEIGWRRYDLDWREGGRRGWSALLRPRYVSGGLAIAEVRDGALRWPLNRAADRTTRLGPFLSLGDLKLAFLFGSESRFLISRQVQILPNLF